MTNEERTDRGHRRVKTGSFIRFRRQGRHELYVQACERDRVDAETILEQERKFTVQWIRMSSNRIWAAKEGPPVVLFEDSVEEYKLSGNKNGDDTVWPRGRDIDELTFYGKVWDYFVFMWAHTKPYKTLATIIIMATSKPLQNLAISFVTNEVETVAAGAPLWVYFLPVLVQMYDRCIYWLHELYIPLNSQRYQLRCMLLTQRVKMPDSHDLAVKWTAGRFDGLLRDVDDIVNGVWGSCLKVIEDLVTTFWTVTFCLLNLSVLFAKGKAEHLPDPLPSVEIWVYVCVFFVVGILTLTLPFLWFQGFMATYKKCETMVRDGQALYLSAASHAVMVDSPHDDESFSFSFLPKNDNEQGDSLMEAGRRGDTEKRGLLTNTGKQSFKVFALSTFRSFFLQLAWVSNFKILMHAIGAFVGYLIMTGEGFGDQFSITSTLIVLLSLKDLANISIKLLSHLTVMSKGILVLSDVAELLNCDIGSSRGSKSVDDGEIGDDDVEVTPNNNEVISCTPTSVPSFDKSSNGDTGSFVRVSDFVDDIIPDDIEEENSGKRMAHSNKLGNNMNGDASALFVSEKTC